MVALLNQPLSIAALATLFAQVQGSSALHSRRSANPSVTLDNGLSVQGSISSSTPNVAQFLGIPYAQPPLNDLRWAPPQPYVATNGTVINGTALPPSCMQYITDLDTMITQDTPQFVIGSAGISEDCLTASVWAPSTAPASKNGSLPVLIWFFGGGFTTGGVDVPYQIPAQWIERSQEHIVVAFNYRLNIFGFPNSPALDQQNLGLLDQRLAVEWVQANIASFGGDASRMVIWGHSAGSEAVDFYNYAWSADPIVKGLIMDSGTAHLEILKSSDTIQSNFSFVASNVGCANQTSSEAELACMRKLPASTIEDFVHSYQDSGASPSIGFSPIADEQVVFSNYTEQGLIGAISDIPAIIGFNGDEGVFLSPYSPTGVNETIATSLSYSVFWCPATKTSAERVAANVTTHRFFYKGNFTNVSPKPWLGAYHGSELPQIFGTAANFNGNSTAFETEVSHAMQDAYVLFASNPETGLESIGWPAYKGAGGDVRVFAEDGVVSQTQSVVAIEEECATLGLL